MHYTMRFYFKGGRVFCEVWCGDEFIGRASGNDSKQALERFTEDYGAGLY